MPASTSTAAAFPISLSPVRSRPIQQRLRLAGRGLRHVDLPVPDRQELGQVAAGPAPVARDAGVREHALQ
jgi:hypothetical protein